MNLGNPNENDSHSFQGIQHHYNTILTKSQVIYLPLFRYFSAISLDFPCRICHNNYVIMKKRENMDKKAEQHKGKLALVHPGATK